jgi:hypothetical protein
VPTYHSWMKDEVYASSNLSNTKTKHAFLGNSASYSIRATHPFRRICHAA